MAIMFAKTLASMLVMLVVIAAELAAMLIMFDMILALFSEMLLESAAMNCGLPLFMAAASKAALFALTPMELVLTPAPRAAIACEFAITLIMFYAILAVFAATAAELLLLLMLIMLTAILA